MIQVIAGALLALFGGIGVILSAIALRLGWIAVIVMMVIDAIAGSTIPSILWEGTWVLALVVVGGLLGLALSFVAAALGTVIVEDA